MAKAAKKPRVIRDKPNETPLAINGTFIDVFKVVKKHKEKTIKKPE